MNDNTKAVSTALCGAEIHETEAERRRSIGSRTYAVAIIVACVLLFLGAIGTHLSQPFGALAVSLLESRVPRGEGCRLQTAAGVIVLGGVYPTYLDLQRRKLPLGGDVERITSAVHLARDHPTFRVVFSGREVVPGLRGFLEKLGIPNSRVLIEGESQSTAENARFTADLLRPNTQEHWILVTSAFHMPRSVGLFRSAGFDIVPYPVGYMTGTPYSKGKNLVQLALKEFLGMVLNRIIGRSNELFPEPEPVACATWHSQVPSE